MILGAVTAWPEVPSLYIAELGFEPRSDTKVHTINLYLTWLNIWKKESHTDLSVKNKNVAKTY